MGEILGCPSVTCVVVELSLGRELGRGGSAVVHAARLAGGDVALKVLHEELAGSEPDRERFLREAEMLAAIDHPNVVRVVEVGAMPDGRPFLAMERIEGETLAARLERGPLSREEAMRRFGELVAAVGALHRAGLVHRDIKPENILCAEDRTVLLDLGIAKPEGGSGTTQTGVVRGTPDFMAPERLFGVDASITSDVYELALVLYLMLAGDAPWEDPTDPSARHDPRPLADPAGPAILRALAVAARKRPQSVADLLGAVESGAAAATPRLTKVVAAAQPRRHWILWAGAVSFALAALAMPWSMEPAAARAQPSTARSVVHTANFAPQQASSTEAPLGVSSEEPSEPEAVTMSPTASPKTERSAPSTPRAVVSATAPAEPRGHGPWCQRYLAFRCSPAAIERMGSTEPCKSARGALAQAGAMQPPAVQEEMCQKLVAAERAHGVGAR
jgi:serine/threonine protein kinase